MQFKVQINGWKIEAMDNHQVRIIIFFTYILDFEFFRLRLTFSWQQVSCKAEAEIFRKLRNTQLKDLFLRGSSLYRIYDIIITYCREKGY